jgi:hypothetical protein
MKFRQSLLAGIIFFPYAIFLIQFRRNLFVVESGMSTLSYQLELLLNKICIFKLHQIIYESFSRAIILHCGLFEIIVLINYTFTWVGVLKVIACTLTFCNNSLSFVIGYLNITPDYVSKQLFSYLHFLHNIIRFVFVGSAYSKFSLTELFITEPGSVIRSWPLIKKVLETDVQIFSHTLFSIYKTLKGILVNVLDPPTFIYELYKNLPDPVKYSKFYFDDSVNVLLDNLTPDMVDTIWEQVPDPKPAKLTDEIFNDALDEAKRNTVNTQADYYLSVIGCFAGAIIAFAFIICYID